MYRVRNLLGLAGGGNVALELIDLGVEALLGLLLELLDLGLEVLLLPLGRGGPFGLGVEADRSGDPVFVLLRRRGEEEEEKRVGMRKMTTGDENREKHKICSLQGGQIP